jgi:CRP/FNR family cyclic AMP-dependent transcriptional regulator
VSLNEEVELLRNVPLFANLEPSKLKLLAFTSERLTFRRDQDLCTEGLSLFRESATYSFRQPAGP